MINVKKILAALLATALCATAMVGCEGKKTSVSEKSTETFVDVNNLNDIKSNVGDSKKISDVQIEYTKVFEPRKASDGKQFVLVEVVVTNNTDSKITIDCYKDFICRINGEDTPYIEYLTAKASKACTDYAHENNNDVAFLNGEIESGKSFKGYYPMEISDDWKTIEIRFVPFGGTSKDAVLLEIKPDMVTKAS